MYRSVRAMLFAVSAAALVLTGCTSPSDDGPGTASDAGWPRTIEHAAGSTELTAKPLRIVSTSPSITGALLSIEAPLVGTAATTVTPLTDGKGFFSQWAKVADDRGVKVAYSNLQLDLDAIDALKPDLIIGSANGGDSTREAYGQLSEIAPTLLFDYGSVTWQKLTEQVARAVGLEDAGRTVLADYEKWVAGQAARIKLPEQPVTALAYLGADGARAFTAATPQGGLLTSLGFTYHDVPAEYAAKAGTDSVSVTVENLPYAFQGAKTLFVVPLGKPDDVTRFAADPLVANAPAVTGRRVYSLGSAAFRLDYYSATKTVELLVSEFGR